MLIVLRMRVEHRVPGTADLAVAMEAPVYELDALTANKSSRVTSPQAFQYQLSRERPSELELPTVLGAPPTSDPIEKKALCISIRKQPVNFSIRKVSAVAEGATKLKKKPHGIIANSTVT